ncbi:hypothetical protein [Pseudomonas oryzihabitans]|uniref:hypothetical protein n=1 Tax=Pseudomonas oryzihabitans TaxID=47885 RepID=UPI0028981E79|nr:hypothetical protein [Pseudomonas oryzihabitans]
MSNDREPLKLAAIAACAQAIEVFEASGTAKEALEYMREVLIHQPTMHTPACESAPGQVTVDEFAVHRQLADVWNAYCALPIEHGNDQSEFCHHIHILQRLISARSGRRQILAMDRALP